jgi:hypothetical protein
VNAAAKDLEVKFKEGADVSESAVSAFCAELNKLVQKLSPSKPKIGIESKELLEKVHKLLELDNADAFSYIKLLKKIPGTDVLIGHLENYDILSALTEMEFVLQKLGV